MLKKKIWYILLQSRGGLQPILPILVYVLLILCLPFGNSYSFGFISTMISISTTVWIQSLKTHLYVSKQNFLCYTVQEQHILPEKYHTAFWCKHHQYAVLPCLRFLIYHTHKGDLNALATKCFVSIWIICTHFIKKQKEICSAFWMTNIQQKTALLHLLLEKIFFKNQIRSQNAIRKKIMSKNQLYFCLLLLVISFIAVAMQLH